MSNETAKCNDQPASERSCPDPTGSVGCLRVFSSMLEVVTDAAIFSGDDLIKLKASIKAALEDCNSFAEQEQED